MFDHGDRPIEGIALAPLQDVSDELFLHVGDLRQATHGLVEVGHALADDRDRERRAVLDEHAAVAVEDDTARRTQGNRALVLVVCNLAVFLVLHDLQEPEADRQEAETADEEDPQAEQTFFAGAPLFDGS